MAKRISDLMNAQHGIGNAGGYPDPIPLEADPAPTPKRATVLEETTHKKSHHKHHKHHKHHTHHKEVVEIPGRCPAKMWQLGKDDKHMGMIACVGLVWLVIVFLRRRKERIQQFGVRGLRLPCCERPWRKKKTKDDDENQSTAAESQDDCEAPLLPKPAIHGSNSTPPATPKLPAQDDTGSSKEAPPAAGAKPATKRQPWLDHAKFIAMLIVNLNHINEMFSHASSLGRQANPPPIMMALADVWGITNMPIFFFCSGLVAKGEFTSQYLRSSVVTLLLPCFMVDTWTAVFSIPSNYWFNPLFMFARQTNTDRLFYIGSGIFENHFWYLPGLFMCRIAMATLAPLGTKALLFVCVISVFLARDGDLGVWPLSHTFSFFPVFVLGFLFKRHDYLTRYLNLMKRRPALRLIPATIALLIFLCALILHESPHRLFFRPFCQYQVHGFYSYRMDGPLPLTGSWVPLVCRAFWMVVYVYAWTGWLPISDLGWVSNLGTRTLTNYMLNRVPILYLGKFGQCMLLDVISPEVFWLSTYLFMPLLTAFLCSHLVTYCLWPLVMPQPWAGPLIGLPKGTPPSSEDRSHCTIGSARGYWPPAFILFTFAFYYLSTRGPPGWWGNIGGFVHAGECMEPIRWIPDGKQTDYVPLSKYGTPL